jgi:hypothetical protein
VIWSVANLLIAYLLVARIGAFDWRVTSHITAFGLGFLLKGIGSARQFGKFHGWNTPTST